MRYHIRITNKAKSDMIQAADYIKFTLFDSDAADKLLHKAEAAMEGLDQFPERYPIIDDPVLSAWGIRFITVNNYLAFYIISEEEKNVYIIRFLYAKRNWRSILKCDVPVGLE